MEAGRGSYFCGLVFGIAVGVAGTHVALSGRPAYAPARLPDLTIGSPIERHSVQVELPPLPELMPELRTAFAPDAPTVHAIATAPADVDARDGDIHEAPRQLPEMSDAEPLAPAVIPQAREDAELRAFIKDELQTLAASEHEIWYETLQGLSRDDATEILRIWKITRGADGGPGLPGLSQLASLPAAPAVPAPAPKPAAHAAPASANSAARRACEQNLANAATPGYKRREVLIFEYASGTSPTAPETDSFAPATWINTAQGQHTQTARPFDCAIQGSGFFQVRKGTETFLTRCGRFEKDESGRLAVRQSDGGLCPLTPEIVVPDGCESLTIESSKVTATVAGSAKPQSLGVIQLFVVFDPSALQPVGDNLFATTDASGPARACAAHEAGGVFQGWIEESNVDPAEERRKLQALEIRSLPQ